MRDRVNLLPTVAALAGLCSTTTVLAEEPAASPPTATRQATAARESGIPRPGQIIYDTDEAALYVGDGATRGGVAASIGRGIPNTFTAPQNLPVHDRGGQVFNVRAFGARGNGSTDDTEAIRSAISAAGEVGGVVQFTAGSFVTSSALRIPSHVTVQGAGTGTVILPSLDSRHFRARAVFEALGNSRPVISATIRDLVIDTRATRRAGANVVSYQIMLSNAERCTLDRVVFRNHGYGSLPGDAPSDPCLLIIAKDRGPDLGNRAGSQYPMAAVGPSSFHRVRACAFEGTGTSQFAVRILTDWDSLRAPSRFVNHCQGNVLDGCVFTGAYGWNVIELAGGGTRQNSIVNCTFKGKIESLTCIDFDKACSYNVAIGNHIEAMSKPSYYLKKANTRLVAIDDHGIPASKNGGMRDAYYSEGNRIIGNTIGAIDSPESPDTLESAICIDASKRSLVQGNVIVSVNATKGTGDGISLRECPQATIDNNNIAGVAVGIRASGSGTSGYKLRITNNEIESADSSINVSGTARPADHAPFGAVISGNACRSSSRTQPVIFVGGEFTGTIISSNQCLGGGTGVYADCDSPIITSNVCRDNTAVAIRVFSSATISANQSHGAPSDVLFGGTVSPSTKLVLSGNSFNTVQAKASAYTFSISDELINADASTGPFTVTLPDARLLAGQTRKVVKTDDSSNAVTVAAHAGQTINGAPRVVMDSQWSVGVFLSDGTGWIKQGEAPAAAVVRKRRR
jgi:hypothetical protein